MTERFDIIILGGGNAGFGVSAVAAPAGKRIAFVEQRDFGGTCPNRGCTPKKVLVAAAHALHEIETASAHGITVGPAKLDWGKLIDRKREMISHLPDAMAGLAAKRGTVFRGTGNSSARTRSRSTEPGSRPTTSSSPPARCRGRCRSPAPS
jgi:glutathione reductase (NADPH)